MDDLEHLLTLLRLGNRGKWVLHQNHAHSLHVLVNVIPPVQLVHVKVEELLVPLVQLFEELWHVVVLKVELFVREEEDDVAVLLDLPVYLLHSEICKTRNSITTQSPQIFSHPPTWSFCRAGTAPRP